MDFLLRFSAAMFLSAGALLGQPRDDAGLKKVILIAGPKSHGPEGNGIHDYPWSVRLLQTMLEHSNIGRQIEVITYLNGWPADSTSLEHASTLMIISDGRDGDFGREALHLASPARVGLVNRLLQRGCGLITFHFSTFAPDELADTALDWSGGYFDWETDGRRQWYSKIETREAEVDPASPGHPVLRGVESFAMREEFYFDIRFRADDTGWKPIWKAASLPSTRPKGQIVAWSLERPGGGRSFATTCGHFYDNWKHPAFRKTILNAIAWTARLPVPEGGVEAPFFDRRAIARHLQQPDLLESDLDSADATHYAEAPYWYKPGHPLAPADAATIRTLDGFTTERILTVPEQFGSWTALTVDPQGRLLAAAQHEPGVYRVVPPPIGNLDGHTRVDRLPGVAAEFGWSHGLLCAFNSLYVTVAERNDSKPPGIYRLRDTNGDDQFDEARLILELHGAGEHGPHNLVAGPDDQWLYLVGGNGTQLPPSVRLRRPVATSGYDRLLPPGFESSRHSLQGWVIRFKPNGDEAELICSGLRNSFDLAFHRDGELFTFDSDMEWDLGTPWYRSTRICHVVSGGEFGWRGGSAVWPAYLEDGTGPVVDIGPGSPTGLSFGYGARFPAKYQQALFACDWTFATIHAIHLTPKGSGYQAQVEEFVGGRGLPVTDLVVGADGALYFVVGGRRLGCAIYRVVYTGPLETAPSLPPVQPKGGPLPRIRKQLESLHGRAHPEAVQAAWPHLGHPDRAIRFAARVALEHQPPEQWKARALKEPDPRIALSALLALARQGAEDCQMEVLDRLAQLPWTNPEIKLGIVRACELALARGGDRLERDRPALRSIWRPRFPDEHPLVNRELCRILCFLGDASVIDPVLDLMRADAGERPLLGSGYFSRNPKYGTAVRDMLESAPLLERMHYAQMLLWLQDGWSLAQRREYFELLADALTSSKGGHQYQDFWNRIRETAMDQVPVSERDALATIQAKSSPLLSEKIPPPKGPGRSWTLESALQAAELNLETRDLTHGRQMFSAAGCVVCHRRHGEGGSIGPDLTSLGQRFTLRDLLDSTINPSKAVSDQYRVATVEMTDGQSISGRIVSRDADRTQIAPDLMRPTQIKEIENSSIRQIRWEPVSTMPTGLLNPLNPAELGDLLAYLLSTAPH